NLPQNLDALSLENLQMRQVIVLHRGQLQPSRPVHGHKTWPVGRPSGPVDQDGKRLKLSTDRPKGTINSTTWDDGECALPARVARAEKCATPQHGRKKILACWRPMISFGACFQHGAKKMRRHD
ncbi:MAG: hypothetical protein ACOH2N_19795, partial [Devosia sp.]